MNPVMRGEPQQLEHLSWLQHLQQIWLLQCQIRKQLKNWQDIVLLLAHALLLKDLPALLL